MYENFNAEIFLGDICSFKIQAPSTGIDSNDVLYFKMEYFKNIRIVLAKGTSLTTLKAKYEDIRAG